MFVFKKNYREVDPETGNAPKNTKQDFKQIKRVVLITAVLALAFLFFNSCWFTIQEEQQAVVCTFGKPKAVTEPGLH